MIEQNDQEKEEPTQDEESALEGQQVQDDPQEDIYHNQLFGLLFALNHIVCHRKTLY